MGFIIDFFHFLFVEWPDHISHFMDNGGDVLWFIALLTLVLWGLSLERLWYYKFSLSKDMEKLLHVWRQRSDHSSWNALQIQHSLRGDIKQRIEQNRNIINSLVVLCPLLGLLGTVTGMIEVFHVMAITGGGDVKLMASGVSKATIPTMAGMVVALSGIFINTIMSKMALNHTNAFGAMLSPDIKATTR